MVPELAGSASQTQLAEINVFDLGSKDVIIIVTLSRKGWNQEWASNPYFEQFNSVLLPVLGFNLI